jgi:ParB family chromosome partitioning protein
MKLSTSLVAVKKINSKLPRSNFSDDDLSRVFDLILKAEGIINPIILQRTSQET